MSAAAHRFDPANDTHYAISEDAQMRLRQIADATEYLGLMHGWMDPAAADPQEWGAAALFHTLSFAIQGALIDSAFVAPGRRK